MRYAVYGLRPDRRYVGEHENLSVAEADAHCLVEYGRYPEAEVWDRTLNDGEGAPVYNARQVGGMIKRIEEHRRTP